MKVCRICFGEKPDVDFYEDDTVADGRKNTCKVCYRERTKARYWRDPEKHRAMKRAQMRRHRYWKEIMRQREDGQ